MHNKLRFLGGQGGVQFCPQRHPVALTVCLLALKNDNKGTDEHNKSGIRANNKYPSEVNLPEGDSNQSYVTASL